MEPGGLHGTTAFDSNKVRGIDSPKVGDSPSEATISSRELLSLVQTSLGGSLPVKDNASTSAFVLADSRTVSGTLTPLYERRKIDSYFISSRKEHR